MTAPTPPATILFDKIDIKEALRLAVQWEDPRLVLPLPTAPSGPILLSQLLTSYQASQHLVREMC